MLKDAIELLIAVALLFLYFHLAGVVFNLIERATTRLRKWHDRWHDS